MTYSDLGGAPDLIYHIVAYQDVPFGEIQVTVQNSTGKVIHVSKIRSVDARDGPMLDLAGPTGQDRVLSDSFSQDRPPITVRDVGDPPEEYLDSKRYPPAGTEKLHRAVGSQLIHGLGLTPAIWTAPFQVSMRSWVYEHHLDWLVKNVDGKPIHGGSLVWPLRRKEKVAIHT